MIINIVTGFPEFFESPFNTSMLSKAREKNLVSIELFDLKNYTIDKHKTFDDTPFGGKNGMVLKPEPFFRVMDEINKRYDSHRVFYFGPEGQTFEQSMARSLSKEKVLTFLCGHFKGIDQRVIDEFVTDRVSIGDFIITGGELASLVVSDAIIRLIPGVLNDIVSAETDSFEDGLLDADYYTRPALYRDLSVPEVLLSGNHKMIDKWTEEIKIKKTEKFKPEMLNKASKQG